MWTGLDREGKGQPSPLVNSCVRWDTSFVPWESFPRGMVLGNDRHLPPTFEQTLGCKRGWVRAGAMQGLKLKWENVLVAPSWVAWNRLLWWPCQFSKLFPWIDGELVILPSLPVCLAKSFIKCNLRLWKFDGKLSHGHEFAWIFVTSRKPWSSLSTHPLHSQAGRAWGGKSGSALGGLFHWVHSAQRPRTGLWLRQMWSSYSSLITCYPYQWGTTSSWPTQFPYIKNWCSDAQLLRLSWRQR